MEERIRYSNLTKHYDEAVHRSVKRNTWTLKSNIRMTLLHSFRLGSLYSGDFFLLSSRVDGSRSC